MKYFIYLVSFLNTISSFSQTEIIITNDVSSGTDYQATNSYIVANNTIAPDAVAVYFAGEYVQLTEGFFADAGSLVLIADIGTTSAKSFQQDVASLNESDLSNVTEFSVYPNPSNGVYTIKSPDNIISYTITNVVGKQITTGNINGCLLYTSPSPRDA